MRIKVRATKDFKVGLSLSIVIKEGDERIVNIFDNNKFHTYTNEGAFFGMCDLDRGWELIDILEEGEES